MCGVLLRKSTLQVFIASQPAMSYRPYSKTCPVPPPVAPPKRWVTKKLCGTVTVYAYDVYLADQFGKTARVTETRYVVPGLPSTSTFTGPPPQDWSGIATPLPLPVISTQPYCTTVTVYE